ncbi:hypothetical protein M8C13_18235 [Crossiella sp. SN42]|uniref:hypothetical protein n=1 Tax=Crossiella sp. SN42 TaxID=2944808 RepID=UPI00207D52FA|nr:hypothetical protein [Crossiella sp. SN42]MCO1577698.1 hypothetical protein [Crossiella sp. SN42]
MTIELTPTQILIGVGVVLVLFLVWRASARRRRAAADAARVSARLLSLTGRVLVQAGFIVGVQWVVITQQVSTTFLLVVLSVPALFAAHTLTKALTVTTVDSPRNKGERR